MDTQALCSVVTLVSVIILMIYGIRDSKRITELEKTVKQLVIENDTYARIHLEHERDIGRLRAAAGLSAGPRCEQDFSPQSTQTERMEKQS